MIARILAALDRAIDFALGTPIPARWLDDPDLDAAVARHPARQGPAARAVKHEPARAPTRTGPEGASTAPAKYSSHNHGRDQHVSIHKTDPSYIVERLGWLLEDLVDDDRALTAAELRNVLAGRDLLATHEVPA